jgi:hypothetical protein
LIPLSFPLCAAMKSADSPSLFVWPTLAPPLIRMSTASALPLFAAAKSGVELSRLPSLVSAPSLISAASTSIQLCCAAGPTV